MFNFLNSTAQAQEAAATSTQAGFTQFIPLILIGVVFYFLIIRPQKKKIKDEQSFVDALQKDVEVFTKSGILGTITGITDKVVTLEIAEGVRIKILRTQIAGLAQQVFAPADASKK